MHHALMRTDMQDHLVALNEIFGYLAENNLAAPSEFAQVAKGGDTAKTYAALQKVMASCVACHMSFRTR